MKVGLLWLRRDLRLSDNPALSAALQQCERVVPVYVHAPDEEGSWSPGAASRWWLHHSLAALAADLRRLSSRLLLAKGPTARTLTELARAAGADRVFCNRLYEPALIQRDAAVERALQGKRIAVYSHNAGLLHEPWQIRKQDDGPYRVFTAYWKACQRAGFDRPLQLAATALPPVSPALPSLDPAQLGLLPTSSWDAGLHSAWSPGESGAQECLQRFLDQALESYASGRDRPDEAGTSRLSPHLHFGEIGPRQIWHALQRRGESHHRAGIEPYIRQLVWREFSQQLLYHFPHTADQSLDPRFAQIPWTRSETSLRLWCNGETGIPIIDAGMRELWQRGWMHNRVRMLTASLLTKNLLIPWQQGARWFWETLVDADLANNTMGWQWTAGCGADAAPYFRIFNPVLQGERFDPEGGYVRTWVPQLAHLPNRYLHQPWTAPDRVLRQAGVRLGQDYPAPIVELKASRERALAAYGAVRQNASR